MANQFLIKETMADMKALSATEIAGLQGDNPIYAGVQLLGYYEKGDTPAPIEYYLSSTSDADNEGSIIEVEGLKFEYYFNGYLQSSYFGVKSDGTDSTPQFQNLLNILGEGNTIVINKGKVKYSSKITITDKSNFTLLFEEGAYLFDSGKTITYSDDTTGLSPVGILFKNCTNFKIQNLVHDNPNFTVKQAKNKIDRVPQLDFDNCSNVELAGFKFKGIVGSYVTGLGTEQLAYEMMSASYLRVSNFTNVSVLNSEIVSGAGNGEFFSFFKGSGLTFKGNTHFQGTSNVTFWSFGKFILTNNVVMEDLKVSSKSTGSFIDIVGDTITMSNIHIDYPNGAFCDVSSEWDLEGAKIRNVNIKDSSTNGQGVLDYATTKLADIDDLTLDNFKDLSVRDTTTPFNYVGIVSKNTTVRNVSFRNRTTIIASAIPSSETDFNKTITFDNLTYTLDSTSAFTSGSIFNSFTTNINNSYINMNNKQVILIDSYLSYASISDLRLSKAVINFNNTIFENCHILFRSNVNFNNCKFINCMFETYSVGSGTVGVHPNITFNQDCSITGLDSANSINPTLPIFQLNSINKLVVKDTKINGQFRNTSAHNLIRMHASIPFGDILFENCNLSYKETTDGSTLITTSKVLEINNSSLITKVTFRDLIVENDLQSLVTFVGLSIPTPTTFIELNFSNIRMPIGKYYLPTAIGDYTNRINLKCTGYFYDYIRVTTNLSAFNIADIRGVFYGDIEPINFAFASLGSIYIRNRPSDTMVYVKTGGTNTNGWQPFGFTASTTLAGIVRQSIASTDSATAPSASYSQSEVQAILTELRDLKTKLRNAGILAS